MLFSKPQPFAEALASSQAKTLLPTSLGTRDLQKLSPDIRERSRFSAKVRSAGHLAVLDDGVNDLAAGQIDLATARLRLKQFLQSTGYVPPEGKAGGLQDFSSDRRIDLQLRINTQQAQGYGWWKQGQDPDLLDAFPAREFVRVESRAVPRTDWPERWNAARAATITDGATASDSGRMVALVGHPIWKELNRFRVEYEPFDFGSGMGTEDVARADAMALGIIARDTQIFPQERPFNENLQATPEIRSDIRFNAKGVFVYQRGGTG
ncbi:MAG: hypothetical protein HY302_10540 [Opitutae bacterium]|nr:hypothetical protein [Opitutae bacterium]